MPKDIVVGINIHHKGFMAYTDNLEQNLDDCAAMGLKMIRYNNNGNTPEALAEIKHVADECHKRGMKIMLCMDHYKSWSHRGERTFEEHEAYFEEYMEKVSAYLKDDIDIYQVFNEMDVSCMGGDIFNITKPGRDGLEKGEYDSVMWDNGIVAMRGSLKGLKKGYDKAVTSVNFCWWHMIYIYAMYDAGCRWDVIGIDWYSDCEEVSSIDLIVKEICDHIPDSEIMICETNQWMNFHARWDEEKRNLIATKESRDKLQAEWVSSFIQKVYDMPEPRFKAIIFYELLDESIYEKNAGRYHGESHFGFIECDERGHNRINKPVYEATKKKIEELGI